MYKLKTEKGIIIAELDTFELAIDYFIANGLDEKNGATIQNENKKYEYDSQNGWVEIMA